MGIEYTALIVKDALEMRSMRSVGMRMVPITKLWSLGEAPATLELFKAFELLGILLGETVPDVLMSDENSSTRRGFEVHSTCSTTLRRNLQVEHRDRRSPSTESGSTKGLGSSVVLGGFTPFEGLDETIAEPLCVSLIARTGLVEEAEVETSSVEG